LALAFERVWGVPAFLDYVHPPPAPAVVDDAERQLGVKLPQSYLALLRVQNGGYTEVKLASSVQSMIWGIGTKFPSITEGSIKSRTSAFKGETWLPDGADRLVPFDGDGHWYLCFDFRRVGRHAEAEITFVDLEHGIEERVAINFSDFLKKLVRDFGPYPIVGLERTSPEEATRTLQRELGLSFGDPDPFAHGYPTQTAKFRDGNPPEWIWVTPNTVPRGFSRSHKRGIQTTAETTLRFPQLPNVGAIITSTHGASQNVMDTLRRSGRTPVLIHIP
jgi:hypothetical protein